MNKSTYTEICRMFDISRITLYNLQKRGVIRTKRFGGVCYLSPMDIAKLRKFYRPNAQTHKFKGIS